MLQDKAHEPATMEIIHVEMKRIMDCVQGLASRVTELQKDVKELRNIRERERKEREFDLK